MTKLRRQRNTTGKAPKSQSVGKYGEDMISDINLVNERENELYTVFGIETSTPKISLDTVPFPVPLNAVAPESSPQSTSFALGSVQVDNFASTLTTALMRVQEISAARKLSSSSTELSSAVFQGKGHTAELLPPRSKRPNRRELTTISDLRAEIDARAAIRKRSKKSKSKSLAATRRLSLKVLDGKMTRVRQDLEKEEDERKRMDETIQEQLDCVEARALRVVTNELEDTKKHYACEIELLKQQLLERDAQCAGLHEALDEERQNRERLELEFKELLNEFRLESEELRNRMMESE